MTAEFANPGRDPKDIETILILGSGPIVIGQACEFDYSGTQACRVLKEAGKRVILVNSNPATIMTDPSMADRTYVEPLDALTLLRIMRKERVEAILPTMGGQTGLNLVLALSKIPQALDRVTLLGANLKAIHLAEDRKAFSEVARSLGLDSPRSRVVRSVEECLEFVEEVGFPFILRPSFTLAGTGQSFVHNVSELREKVGFAISQSPIGEVLVEESVLGWKEYELEVMRDRQDNAIIVCSIENLDPMGVHTGDSLTVAPQQTLTDREYQAMRAEAIKIIRRVGVETGGCNVQFAVHPKTGRRIIIEMNPRVSRSSALASKVTGFPIAHVAAKLALGYTLPEIQNAVTGTTKACFEPPIDYVAVKIPRWNFEKFPGVDDSLGPSMQSVGEVVAIGGSFGEAYHKALCSLERSWPHYDPVDSKNPVEAWTQEGRELLGKAHSRRCYCIWDSLASGVDPQTVSAYSGWDPWFTQSIQHFQNEHQLGARAKSFQKIGKARFEMIDTCSAETRAQTPFFYSTREHIGTSPTTDAKKSSGKKRVVILGSGPNRIGQGVEFDYCCVHSSLALREAGFETVMINCNPETVSTDPSTSDTLYLEPLNEDCVRDILDRELGSCEGYVLLQMGGQTPLKLAAAIESWGFKTLGTPKSGIDLCEDRGRFAELLEALKIPYPAFGTASSLPETLEAGKKLGYPLLVRPSYVLGGQGMRICGTEAELGRAFAQAKEVSETHPLYLDRFLLESLEFDVDGICDGKNAFIAGIMEQIEEAGIHSGDSMCVVPPFRLPQAKIHEMAELAKRIAVAVGARGFFNVQFAVTGETIHVIEANPRASRTIPFLAKATGLPLVRWALKAALGESILEITKAAGIPDGVAQLQGRFAVKAPVFPFSRFRGFDPIWGPEMRSTGEVMGIDTSAGAALAKAFSAAGLELPAAGNILFSIRDQDKPKALNIARVFKLLGFKLFGTPGTAAYLKGAGLNCTALSKIGEAPLGEDLLSYLERRRIDLVVNTRGNVNSIKDGLTIRKAAMRFGIPVLSTLSAAEMASMAIQSTVEMGVRPVALQELKPVGKLPV